MTDAAPSAGEIATLERPLYLLTFFTPRQTGWTLSALARASALPKASCLRSIRVLEKYSFLRREGDVYRLGTRFIELSSFVQDSAPARNIALPYLHQLSQRTGWSVSWAVLQGSEGLYAEVITAPGTTPPPIHSGQRLSLTQGASASILMAFAPQQIRQQTFSSVRALLPTAGRPVADLDFVDGLARKTWLAVWNEPPGRGRVECAAPVFQANGKVVAALAVHGEAETSPDPAVLRQRLLQLSHGAEAISRDLGYSHEWQGDTDFFLQMLRGVQRLS
ncbi:helix-turn-helix domain-containing protein (plasmid) [Deinococcus sp. KNUC1210]|uniref:IclR family transcriptional regulator n=1 Tax=Deinococcus sp. KNUC1210 TaxID=2917691 RepID=UPI001EF0C71E|nr:helix-turn-helix domain-containing protein [Deinococcus sp. KNUC1210]ULH13842.1 helix-turn-helix domain-containing protein [Deinococcus sp. KNUC1210]